nr:lysine-rich arabinogalactan protein 19-like [Aegilops tauschii subsp. strangulata]
MQVADALRPPSAVAGADPVTGSPSTAPLSSSQLLPPAPIWSAGRPLADVVAAASFVVVSGHPEPPRARCQPPTARGEPRSPSPPLPVPALAASDASPPAPASPARHTTAHAHARPAVARSTRAQCKRSPRRSRPTRAPAQSPVRYVRPQPSPAAYPTVGHGHGLAGAMSGRRALCPPLCVFVHRWEVARATFRWGPPPVNKKKKVE